MKNLKSSYLSTKGQALLEFFMFLPIMLALFVATVAIVGAINGSINQLKSLRGYFYFIIKGNTKIPSPDDIQYLAAHLKLVGMYSVGWMDYMEGTTAVAPCYKMGELVSQAQDTCEQTTSINAQNNISNFIRAYSVYGVCTAYLYSLDGANPTRDVSGLYWDSGYCSRQ